MRRIAISVLAVIGILSAVAYRVTAQDAAAPGSKPAEIVDRVMGLIGQGRVDDAVTMMDGFKNHPDFKEGVRNQLISLRTEQGQYHGYDIAATQRFTPNFQKLDVLANYEDQPVLLRFSFYRPSTDGKWTVLWFRVNSSVAETVDILRDSQAEAAARHGRDGSD